jgi:hypothetical protein
LGLRLSEQDSRLPWFGMAARALAHAGLAAKQDGQPHTSQTSLDDAREHLRRVEPSHDKAYDLLLFGRTYHGLARIDPALVLRAAEVFTEAADLAQRRDHPRAASYAWGYLSRLYEGEGRHAEALQFSTADVLRFADGATF